MGEGKEYVSRSDELGNIHISEEVLAVISAAAAQEVEGVSSLAGSLSGDLAELVAGKKAAEFVAEWQPYLQTFREKTASCLIYP